MDDRKVMQQALEALRGYRHEMQDMQACDAERALEAALAQEEQAEPVAWRYKNPSSAGFTVFQQYPQGLIDLGESVEPLYAHPPQPVLVQEARAELMLKEALRSAEWQDKHIYPVRGETHQNWLLKVYLPVPLSASDKSPEAALRAAMAQEERAEPVAFVTTNEDGDYAMLFFDREEAATYCDDHEEPIPLYTAPPRRKPLTEDDIAQMWSPDPGGNTRRPIPGWHKVIDFARAIVRAAAEIGRSM